MEPAIQNYRRVVPFVFGCLGSRIALVWLAYTYPQWLRVMGFLALLPALGFFTIWVTGSRHTGIETGGAPIWWNWLRPVHGFLYLLFAALAISGIHEHAWKVLALDVFIGFTMWLHQQVTTVN